MRFSNAFTLTLSSPTVFSITATGVANFSKLSADPSARIVRSSNAFLSLSISDSMLRNSCERFSGMASFLKRFLNRPAMIIPLAYAVPNKLAECVVSRFTVRPLPQWGGNRTSIVLRGWIFFLPLQGKYRA